MRVIIRFAYLYLQFCRRDFFLGENFSSNSSTFYFWTGVDTLVLPYLRLWKWPWKHPDFHESNVFVFYVNLVTMTNLRIMHPANMVLNYLVLLFLLSPWKNCKQWRVKLIHVNNLRIYLKVIKRKMAKKIIIICITRSFNK